MPKALVTMLFVGKMRIINIRGIRNDYASRESQKMIYLAHPAGIVPVVGTNNLDRMARLGDALKVQMDLETWYALWTLAAGQEVP